VRSRDAKRFEQTYHGKCEDGVRKKEDEQPKEGAPPSRKSVSAGGGSYLFMALTHGGRSIGSATRGSTVKWWGDVAEKPHGPSPAGSRVSMASNGCEA
jgi:hypothetical protein